MLIVGDYMSKKEEFKEFIKDKPSFVKAVNSGEISWQGIYELYDLYGKDSKVSDKYLEKENTIKSSEEKEDSTTIKGVLESLKGINMEEVKENLTSLQKAVNFLQDFVVPEKKVEKTVESIINPKPIDSFFDD